MPTRHGQKFCTGSNAYPDSSCEGTTDRCRDWVSYPLLKTRSLIATSSGPLRPNQHCSLQVHLVSIVRLKLHFEYTGDNMVMEAAVRFHGDLAVVESTGDDAIAVIVGLRWTVLIQC